MTLSEARADGCHLLVERFINSGEECASKGEKENVNENRFFHKDIQIPSYTSLRRCYDFRCNVKIFPPEKNVVQMHNKK